MTGQFARLTYPASSGMRVVMTLCISALGTVAFLLGGLPLPFLFGPMAACLVVALAKAPLKSVAPAEALSRAVLGVTVGTAITPAALALVPSMAASLLLVPLYIAIIGLVGIPYFRRICGYDLPTSWYAAMPGGLVEMVQFGREAGGNPRTLSLVHATRITVFITIAPVILVWGFGASLDNPPGPAASGIPLSQLALMAFAGLAGWFLAAQIGLFGATILGPMFLATLLSLTGVITHRPPAEAIIFAQFFLGTGVGTGYVALSLRELRKDVFAGLGFVVIVAALTASFAQLIVLSGLAPPMDGFLAFSPAGQAEMTILAIIVGADLGFVILHHVLRMVLVVTGAPLAARALGIGHKPVNRNDDSS